MPRLLSSGSNSPAAGSQPSIASVGVCKSSTSKGATVKERPIASTGHNGRVGGHHGMPDVAGTGQRPGEESPANPVESRPEQWAVWLKVLARLTGQLRFNNLSNRRWQEEDRLDVVGQGPRQTQRHFGRRVGAPRLQGGVGLTADASPPGQSLLA